MANQLKMAMVHAILTLTRLGWSQRRIAQELEVDRETVARYVHSPPADPVSPAGSAAGRASPGGFRHRRCRPASGGQTPTAACLSGGPELLPQGLQRGRLPLYDGDLLIVDDMGSAPRGASLPCRVTFPTQSHRSGVAKLRAGEAWTCMPSREQP
jgi:hypothetical protein